MGTKFPTVEELLGVPSHYLFEISTPEEGWGLVEKAILQLKDPGLFPGLCRAVFRRLVSNLCLEHGQGRLAQHADNSYVDCEEVERVLKAIVVRAGAQHELSVRIVELLESFSPEAIQQKLAMLVRSRAEVERQSTPPNRSRRNHRPPEMVRPSPARIRTTAMRP